MSGHSSSKKEIAIETMLTENYEKESTASTLNLDQMPPVSNTIYSIHTSTPNDMASIPRVTGFAQTRPMCARCNRPIYETEGLLISGKIIHTKCTRCSLCNKDFESPIESQKCFACISTIPTVIEQPDPVQICAYRIVPPVVISTQTPVVVELVESGTRKVIENGIFIAKDPEILDDAKYRYRSIKLNQKQPINEQVKGVVTNTRSVEYRLKFSTIQGRSTCTNPFKLYSNLNQLSPEDRDKYRKRKTDDPDEDDSGNNNNNNTKEEVPAPKKSTKNVKKPKER